MKILIIITGLDLGGAEIQVSQLADHLVDYGNEVEIISMMGDVNIKPENNKIKIHNLNISKNFISIISSLKKSKKIIKNFNPDIVHSHLFHGNIFSRILKILSPRIKLINTEHSKYIGSKSRKILYKYTKFIPDHCTNVSNEALDNFNAQNVFLKKKTSCIYNGIDTKKFQFSDTKRIEIRKKYNIAEDIKLILAVGRLAKPKDYINLINAISINNTTDKVHLWIIGDGSELSNIKKKIQELKVEDKVSLLGKKNNIPDFMSACDLFVSSSAWEGFGLVIAEAMSCERLIVATDSGGVKEVLSHYGFIVPIKNSTELSKKISYVLNLDDKTADEIRKQGRKHVIRNFSFSVVINNWLELYKKITNHN
ncbi:glycosyltransferase [Providencia rettgeri]